MHNSGLSDDELTKAIFQKEMYDFVIEGHEEEMRE
jgi:hypothetical protein